MGTVDCTNHFWWSNSRINRDLKLLLEGATLRPQRFHDLRHTFASLLLASGVSPRTLMEWLKHNQSGITMNIYAHVMPAAKQDAAESSRRYSPEAHRGQTGVNPRVRKTSIDSNVLFY